MRVAKKRLDGKILHVDGDTLYRAEGYSVLISTDGGKNWRSWITLPVSKKDRIITVLPLFRRLFRKSIHHLMVYENFFVVFANKESFVYLDKQLILRAPLHGSRPLVVCTTPSGEMYYGEYVTNYSTKTISIFKICKNTLIWEPVWTFENVRHVHGVFHDPYTDAIWVTTGDYGEEIGIWRTDDAFRTLAKVVGNTQQYRTIQLLFTEDHIYFGSDTPLELNYIYRMDRDGHNTELLMHVDSSIFYGCKVGESLFFSTCVEPSVLNKTRNVDVFRSDNGSSWYKYLTYKKDFLPMRYFQYGQVTFPSGKMENGLLYCTPLATNNSNKICVVNIHQEISHMTRLQKYIRLFHTVKYLRFTQIAYRIYYTFRKKWRSLCSFRYPDSAVRSVKPLHLKPSINAPVSFQKQQFTFLNLTHSFESSIDWNFSGLSKLWKYNLAYFDFLHQESMETHTGLKLIHDFIRARDSITDGLEPFPISLRGINWIKFLTYQDISDPQIDASLFNQYRVLTDNLEYHLLGNHLLENGFSLLFGAYYFRNENFYATAEKILLSEMNEQILSDGGHFELSPMYHQIMLYRILECINLMQNNEWHSPSMLSIFESKASIMLGWLKNMTFSNGSIPHFNDSANGIAPTSAELFDYASRLQISPAHLPLNDSGYRRISTEKFECIVDVGSIGPDYIPGHAHSDTFNFELHVDGHPVIIDTGTSTYEANAQRQSERSTSAHNTVTVDDKEQSNVWGGFRVAERAKIIALSENDHTISAVHDGYKNLGAFHKRTFSYINEKLTISDHIESHKPYGSIAYLHFHPSIVPVIHDGQIQTQFCTITCTGHHLLELDSYDYAEGFNTLQKAKCLKIHFLDSVTTVFDIGLKGI